MSLSANPGDWARHSLDLARTRGLSRALLSFAPTRNVFNTVHDRLGHTLAGRVIQRAIGAESIGQPFVWRNRVLDKELRIPVVPELAQGSLHTAFNWSLAEHRHFRRFYEFYLRASKPGVFFDVGANLGSHSYPMALHGHQCICFEPQEVCTRFIERVARLNEFDSIEIVRAALGETDGGVVEFFTSASTWLSSMTREQIEQYEPATAIQVPVTTLDVQSARLGLMPQLLKIDVEGWEAHVLRGATQLLEIARPTILVEVWRRPDLRGAFWDLLQPYGYACVSITPSSDSVVYDRDQFLTIDGYDFVFFPTQARAEAYANVR